MARPAPILLLALVALLALAGCGGGDGAADRRATPAPSAPPPARDATPEPSEAGPGDRAAPVPSGPVTAAERAIIRGWADALRAGDVERAARYWRPPAIASNGGPPYRLVTMRAVRTFNAGLTCGARLLSVERDKRYLLATFRLTDRRDRPGACAQGAGQRARTLFLLRDGGIVQWIRAADPPSEGSGAGVPS